MLKNNRKEKDKNTKILKLNLSATMMVAGIIVGRRDKRLHNG